jgi:hypothetical protein
MELTFKCWIEAAVDDDEQATASMTGAMARARPELQKLSEDIKVHRVNGLTPPPGMENEFPFFWISTYDHKAPDKIRWVWSPLSGEMIIGNDSRHFNQLGENPTHERDSYVKGFYFPEYKTVAIRPFHWPQNIYDGMNWKVSDRVCGQIKYLLERKLAGKGIKFYLDAHNKGLTERFPRLVGSW